MKNRESKTRDWHLTSKRLAGITVPMKRSIRGPFIQDYELGGRKAVRASCLVSALDKAEETGKAGEEQRAPIRFWGGSSHC